MSKNNNAQSQVVTPVETSQPMDALNSRLASALTIDQNTFYEKVPTQDGGEVEVTKKTYNFVNPVGKRSSMTVYDATIIESMEKIAHALHGKTILTYAICKEFSKIAESGKLENMGFKTVAEFGKAVFGLETSTVNHYARIGANFINDDYSVKSGLPELSVSHFIELSSKVENGDISPIIELYTNGTLIDGMSTKKIRETLKSLNGTALPDNATTEPEKAEEKPATENTADVVVSDNDIAELEANFDSQVVVGKILNACSAIEQLFAMLNKHEVKAVGWDKNLDTLKALAKELL